MYTHTHSHTHMHHLTQHPTIMTRRFYALWWTFQFLKNREKEEEREGRRKQGRREEKKEKGERERARVMPHPIFREAFPVFGARAVHFCSLLLYGAFITLNDFHLWPPHYPRGLLI